MTDNKRLLEISDLDYAADLMGRSFQNDAFIEYVMPNIEKRSSLLPKFFRILLKYSIQNQQAYGVGYPLAGVSIWCLPHQKRIDITGLVRAGLLKLLFQGFLVPFFRAIKVFRIIGITQEKYAHENDYYLSMLAVSPESQGHGFASKLVRPFLEQADAQSAGVYVETMTLSDVRMYEHFGFQRMEEHEVRRGFSIWALHRSATPQKVH